MYDFWQEYQDSLKTLDIEDDNIKVGFECCVASFTAKIKDAMIPKIETIIERVNYIYDKFI